MHCQLFDMADKMKYNHTTSRYKLGFKILICNIL